MTSPSSSSNYPVIQRGYTIGSGSSDSDAYITYFSTRDPTTNDINFPITKRWVNLLNLNDIREWILIGYTKVADQNGATWILLTNGGAAQLLSITGDDGVVVDPNPATGNINFLGLTVVNATHAKPVFTESPVLYTEKIDVQVSTSASSANINNAGLASFLSTQFTVDSTTGFVQITNFSPFNYTQVTHNGTNPSPYTVTATDNYISCDTTSSTAGTITILLPNAPTTYRRFIIKDRTGAASTSNITVTTVGGAVTIDGATSYIMAGNYDAIDLLFNGTSYEVY